jgi:acetylornithine deacetylase/succinyl-diaminopimelate desuccinylase-like protein
LSADPPATTASVVVEATRAACADLGIESLPMISRAYHDSLFMARIAPTGMIFIPCRNGISHRPDEYSSPAAIARGVEVLALVLGRLTAQEDGVHAGRTQAR